MIAHMRKKDRHWDIADETAFFSMFRRLVRIGWKSLAALIAVAGLPAAAQQKPTLPGDRSTWPVETLEAQAGPRQFVTHHHGTFGGVKVDYIATVGETIVKDRDGKAAASLFSIDYVRENVPAPVGRPVVFIYNGGPGAGSNYLQLGAFGPVKMAQMSVEVQADPKTPLAPNPDTILDVADLVFIDPPETGYSRLLPGVDPQTFRNSDADAAACVQLIRRWLKDHGRNGSPVFLVGESFGTHRNIHVGRDLARLKSEIRLAGMVMVSGPVPANTSLDPAPLDAVDRVIDVAAWSWYYGLIDNREQTLAQAVERARDFALGPYIRALLLGNRLDERARADILIRLSSLTGLSTDYYRQNDLIIKAPAQDLLRSEGKVLSLFDIRHTEPAASAPSDEERDWDAMVRGVDANMQRLGSATLKVKGLGDYRTLAPGAVTWDWTFIPNAERLESLARQMQDNPSLRVLVGIGLYDRAASMGADENAFARMGKKEQVTLTYYAAGHMLYTDEPGLKAFLRDVRAFVQGLPVPGGIIPKTEPNK
ncbi:MAG: hypothetical protein QM601_11110 [Pseudoxanthomonas sp.]